MIKTYDIIELPNVIEWSKYQTVAIIGKGKEAHKYKFNTAKVMVFGINDSILLYREAKYSVVIQGHWAKIFSNTNMMLENLFFISKRFMRNKQHNLVYGCTPSLFLSAIIQMVDLKRIYLQGFSMDGVSPKNELYPYDWVKQENAFKEIFKRCETRNIDIGFVSLCTRMSGYKRFEPLEEDII